MAVEKHKPGPLKQQNKTHKHGRHKSKGTMDKQNKGRVSVKVLSKKGGKQGIGKISRRNQAKQLRSKKRDEVLEQKRKIGKQGSPPHIIVIVPLSSSADSQAALKLFTACDEDNAIFPSSSSTTIVSPHIKQRFTFLALNYGDMYSILDGMKIADTVVFITAADNPLDSHTDNYLSAIFAQGLPTTFHCIQGLDKCPAKKRNETKKTITKMIEKRFPKDKPHPLDTAQDALVALRLISNQHQRSITFRDNRPHLLAQNITYEPNGPEDTDRGTLKVTGYIRGKTLSANRLVHLAGFGDFQMSQIEAANDPFSSQIKRKNSKAGQSSMAVDEECSVSAMDEDVRIIDKASPSLQESLQSEVEPDPMEGEQTWPTEDELLEAEELAKKHLESKKMSKRVPKGTSDYQAAWIMDDANDDDDDGGDDDDDDDEESEDDDDEYISAVREESDGDESMKMEDDEEYETISVTEQETDNSKYDEAIDVDEERLQFEKIRAEHENEMFPDEMDTPTNVPARTRFQKYRGLKSFRTSPWDPKENLPQDYARIFQFQSFNRTRKRVMREDEVEGAEEGWYVTIHIINVPKAFIDSYDARKPLVVFGLLPHEQKMSVVHFVVKRIPTNTDAVKSKERLIFHCGYRRFSARSVFSQHTSGDKHKYERFLPHEGVSVVSVYAPIMFAPCPVLVFTPDQKGTHSLLASGSLYKVDPDRIITKKIVLSGFPYKINKRSAVIRYMFYNREDILWFKPVELFTKYGRRGHIKEPLGTHGHMKCVLDGTLKAQDTICMNLYKRVFPKWSYEPTVPLPAIQQTYDPVAMDT